MELSSAFKNLIINSHPSLHDFFTVSTLSSFILCMYALCLTAAHICMLSGPLLLHTPSENRVSELPKISSSRSQTYRNFDVSMRSSRISLSHNISSIHSQEIHLIIYPLPLIYTLQVGSLEVSSRSFCPHSHFVHIVTYVKLFPVFHLSMYPIATLSLNPLSLF
jgi:hypothetical protein